MNNDRIYLAIPLGDPAGIGPEIVVKSLLNPEVNKIAKCVVIGNKSIVEQALTFCKKEATINCITDPKEGVYKTGTINLIDIDNVDMSKFEVGKISGMCGKAAYEYIEKSISLAMDKQVSVVVTPPINKEALKAGNVNFIGHTEIFGKLTNSEDPLTMFEVDGLRVLFLSRHVSLREACDLVTKERIIDYVHRSYKALEKLGLRDSKMAIAGLNPHSGEHGLFGDEETNEIIPAVKQLQEEGYNVYGPIGADSVFHMALIGKFDSVLSLYHDQGHIATKTYDFEKTISLTLGMPILRTSVDHGTAMDIAGTGLAREVSMEEAIRLAVKYAPTFSESK